MLRPKSTMSAATSKIVVILAFLCLMIAAIFGLLGSYKVDALRTEVASANAARDAAEHRRVTQETELKARETAVAGEEAKIAEAENRAAKAGAELAQPRFRFLRRKPLRLSHPSPSIRSRYVRTALRVVEFALCRLIRRAAV